MLSDIFRQLGFDPKEIELYMKLLETGPTRASTLAYLLHWPRTSAHNILDRLERDGFVTKAAEKNVYVFSAVHPENLARVMEMKQRATAASYEKAIAEVKKAAPQLIGLMKSNKSLPNVRFYQGREAVRTVLFDTLTSKTELKDYANIDAMFAHVKDINDAYVVEREKSKVTKRSLLLDTPFAHQVYESGAYSPKSHKGYKWIKKELYPFAVEMNIYDGKVSYLTYVENDFVGVIIENEHIYRLHDSLWSLAWDLLESPQPRQHQRQRKALPKK